MPREAKTHQRRYSRTFLLSLQYDQESIAVPEGLEHAADMILGIDKVGQIYIFETFLSLLLWKERERRERERVLTISLLHV